MGVKVLCTVIVYVRGGVTPASERGRRATGNPRQRTNVATFSRNAALDGCLPN